ncbi:hypothetical protein TEA_013849 [Camellia sinensis var. sinensis]|uniref:HD domain-containing protein n=1 Tax=Camellia sinensis var. sinensis TaxID=542762 RepID=A0A4S4EHB2_CAMSN|nr:hypothetical protein TEA_013849 [Camellia sinensis var. sinensis]
MYWPNRTEKANAKARFTAASALAEIQAEKASTEANTPAATALAEAQKGVATPNTPVATTLAEAQKVENFQFGTDQLPIMKYMVRTWYGYMYRYDYNAYRVHEIRIRYVKHFRYVMAIVGDITPSDGVPKHEKSWRKQEELDHMCKLLGGGQRAQEIGQLWMEYEENLSLEAKVVKDFDKVEMTLQALEYETGRASMFDTCFFSTIPNKINPTGLAWGQFLGSWGCTSRFKDRKLLGANNFLGPSYWRKTFELSVVHLWKLLAKACAPLGISWALS